MSSGTGISFLHRFDFGNRDIYNPGQNILSVTSQASGDFDKLNLNTESSRHRWRSTDVLNWQEIVIKAEKVSNIDTFAIIGHNFTPDVVVQLQANISDNWLAPPVTVTIPYMRENMVWLSELGDQFEYYRVRILDPTNPCGFIEIGRIVGGRATTMSNNEDITDSISIATKDYAEVISTEGFFRQSNQRVKARTLSVKFAKLDTKIGNNTNFVNLRSLFDYVGISVPFLTIVDRDDPELFTGWGQMSTIPAESYTVNRYMTMPFKFDEVF